MEKFVHTLVHSLKDTAPLIPFLLIVYFLIELLEYKNVFRFEKSKLLNGKASPVIGSCFGIIPQCGFSVISAELFSEKKMSMAALIAVFLATSDEAFPILISNYKSIPTLLLLILVKFIIAIIVGYFVMFVSKKFFKSNNLTLKINNSEKDLKENDDHIEDNTHKHNKEDHHSNLHDENHNHEHENHEHLHEDSHEHNHKHEENHSNHSHAEDSKKEENHSHIHACCHHDISGQSKFNWKHPIIHSIKIALYIFIVNFILTGAIELIGEDKLSSFLTANSALQPLLALIVGFIPNCASSVIITELFMSELITFGSLITGLCANAGLGIFVLFKANKNIKENLFIVGTIIVSSLVFGYAFHFIPLDFLHF